MPIARIGRPIIIEVYLSWAYMVNKLIIRPCCRVADMDDGNGLQHFPHTEIADISPRIYLPEKPKCIARVDW
jgi:hypothetical protein